MCVTYDQIIFKFLRKFCVCNEYILKCLQLGLFEIMYNSEFFAPLDFAFCKKELDNSKFYSLSVNL